MNYRVVVIEDLRRYQDLCAGAERLRERIAELKEQSTSREIAGDENALIRNIVERDRLAWNLRSTLPVRRGVKKGLEGLSAEEQRILEEFYITPSDRAAEELAHELACPVHEVYRRRDRALRRMTRRMYGIDEL